MAEANTASKAPAQSGPASGGKSAPAAAGEKPSKKKLRPTNCVQSNKRIRRKDWYYRDGKYFANKQCYKLWKEAQEAEKKKAGEAAKAAKAEEVAKAASADPAGVKAEEKAGG